MPRVTRATVRLNAMLEETNLAASTPLPLTPFVHTLRPPLGEITGNSEDVKAMVSNLEELVKAQKKAPPKEGRRGNVQNNEKKVPVARRQESIEVIEDDNQSATSSAVDEACQDLMRESSGEMCQIVIHDKRPHTPPTPAVNMVKKHLSNKTKTQKANSTAPLSPKMAISDIQKHEIATIQATNEIDDFALDQIMVSSPTKPITRIEDSVEAIDAFEEAIEKVGELIPAIAEGPRSPKKATKAEDASITSSNKTGSDDSNLTGLTPAVARGPRSPKLATKAGDAGSNNKKTGSNDSNLTAPTKPARSSDVEPRRMTTRAISKTSTPAKPKRISSIHRAPFQPTKSTKPPTRSNFELPGEAVARKLKEQREARLKREEVEPATKLVLRNRPARVSQAPVVRQTTTSSARLSLAKADFKKASPLRQRASVDGKKRLSALSQAKRTRPSLSANATGPSTNAMGSVGLRSSTVSSPSHIIGVPGTSRAPIAASDAAQLKLRGKEVFNRNRVELDERERARKEKEEAARKARAEAAERGRIASREWAEKQRMKKTATGKENQGD